MSFEVYPVLPGLEFGTERTYAFATNVQENVSGREVREAVRSLPIRSWRLRYEFLRQYGSKNEFKVLVGFFMRHRGRFDDFFFEDPADNTAVDALLGAGTGAKTVFQCVRPIEGFAEPIRSLKGVQQVKVNGVVKTPVTDWTWNAATGEITFAVAPTNGHAVVVSFTYYWKVRFTRDDLTLREFAKLFFNAQSLELKYVIT